MPDYNNQYTTTYSTTGGANGGGFMPGTQSGDSPSTKRTYGKETLRPATIKQLVEAHHPYPDADHFMIDGAETTQVTFVGQVRNISQQTTNVTYKLDDGTGTIEVKVWVDMDAQMDEDGSGGKGKVTEGCYARVWGRLKLFGNKRHLGAQYIRPIQDFNEIQYHMLEATAIHLHFARGPIETLQQGKDGANGQTNGQMSGGDGGGGAMPSGLSASAKKVYQTLKNSPQTNEGLHMQDIANRANMDISEVLKAGEELTGSGAIYTTVDDHTWAILDM